MGKTEYPEFILSDDVIGPKSERQYDFFHSDAFLTVFGGAAGSGKSYLGVMDVLPYVHLPYFRAVFTRQSMPQINGPGGLKETADFLFKTIDPGVMWRERESHYLFSSGARVYMRPYPDEAAFADFEGWQVNHVLFDEGQYFTQPQILKMFSRVRNVKCPEAPFRIKITCNPDYNSPLRRWLEWYLDPETGIPRPDRAGALRYFLVINGELVWADTREELLEQYGKKHLAADDPFQVKPLSFRFIPATVHDNPMLLKVNPDYVQQLEGLPEVEKASKLYGSWYARERGSTFFLLDWVEYVDFPEQKPMAKVRAWDLAGSLVSDMNKNPDFTVGVLMSKNAEKIYTVEDVKRVRMLHGEVEELILQTAREDGDDVTILVPCEPGAAGKAYAARLVSRLAENGFYARTKPTNKAKIERFKPFCAQAGCGGVRVVRDLWNDDYIDELVNFDGTGKRGKDDQVDATSDAFWCLNYTVHLPNFALPDLSKVNPLRQI